MVLEVFSPPLGLIRLDKPLVKDLIAREDLATMLLYVKHVFLIQLEIVLRVVVQVAGLPDYLGRHLVCNELLPSAEDRQRGESGKALSLDELDQVKLSCY